MTNMRNFAKKLFMAEPRPIAVVRGARACFSAHGERVAVQRDVATDVYETTAGTPTDSVQKTDVLGAAIQGDELVLLPRRFAGIALEHVGIGPAGVRVGVTPPRPDVEVLEPKEGILPGSPDLLGWRDGDAEPRWRKEVPSCNEVLCSADGRFIAVYHYMRFIYGIYCANSGEWLFSVESPCAWHPVEPHIAWTEPHTLRVREASASKRKPHGSRVAVESVSAITFMPDGKSLLLAHQSPGNSNASVLAVFGLKGEPGPVVLGHVPVDPLDVLDLAVAPARSGTWAIALGVRDPDSGSEYVTLWRVPAVC